MSRNDQYYLGGLFNAAVAALNAGLYAGTHGATSLGVGVFCALSSLGLFARAAA